MRVLIIGGPRTGKTTLGRQMAEELGLPYRSTDETMHMAWSSASAEVSTWLNGDYGVIEGVALPRALRKWRETNPNSPAPVDRVIHLSQPYEELKTGQVAMTAGINTVLSELTGWLPEFE